MLLTEIKNYIRSNQILSLFDISKQFNVEPQVLRDMLDILVRKGQIRRCLKDSKCGTQCNQCSALFTEIYQWIN